MIDIDTHSPKEQRRFGLVMAVAFAVLALLRSAIAGEFRPLLLYVGLAFLVAGLVYPRCLKPVLELWIKLALALNWALTRVLLAIVFYAMITPVRILILLFGDDPLKRAWLLNARSYWVMPEEQPDDIDRYRKQF